VKSEYTPTETRLLNVLGDGKPHNRKELRLKCLNDELLESGLKMAISKLRKKINPIGQDIICTATRFEYILVRLIAPNSKE